MNNYWFALIGMTCLTFSCRYLFFSETMPFRLGPKLTRILSFTAPSVLTAMWVPLVFLGHQKIEGEFITSPFLIAGIIAIILSLKTDKTLLVLVMSMGSFSLVKAFLN
ncbi:AzlD domain-containing protein [uncultured Paraglaciecola sp.]|uniref:AzlD domain-containing protein n=1 Tax=uncultured Paraglaciecola sp. TaxID=1765024 RepID=UPI002596ABBB|nr:AzlD domain-containing protein [uncultured Paraglaciecola sp.]